MCHGFVKNAVSRGTQGFIEVDIPCHYCISGEQDQLADLLTRMFEEFSKSADLTEPPAPPYPALDSAHLSADYSNVVQQLRQLVKS